MDRLLIVDGMNLTFQMFYGMPSRIVGRHGREIRGTLGFVGALLRMIRRFSPTHVAVVFDGEHHNPRTDLDPEYKANRPDWSKIPEEEAPFSQLPDIYAALDSLGIARAETTVCECDDVIAAYARKYGDTGEVYIMSQDSDFFQLISDNVRVIRYRGDSTALCDREYLKCKFGITPETYAYFKSLVGDKSDNIRGADKVGPKTAAALIERFGSLDGILSSAENIERKCVRESILASGDRLLKNLDLIRLDGCAEIPFSLGEMRYFYDGRTTGEVLSAIGV